MLVLYTNDGGTRPLPFDDYHVRELPSGLDELEFKCSIWDPAFPLIQEESLIREESEGRQTLYRVKAIDGGTSAATVRGRIELDDWEASPIVGYSLEAAPGYIVETVTPAGWHYVDNSGITRVATVEADGTALDVLEAAREQFEGLAYRFDRQLRRVTLYDAFNGPNLGAFLTRELNLRGVQYKGKSSDIVTRLYAYGKDGLSIAAANNGLPYVDNFSYTSRVICGVWTDERFTVAGNLLEAAQAKLAEMAVPERSYECDAVDLAAAYPGTYDALSFALFSQLGLIDETRSAVKILHRVTERWRYPEHPEKNKVILSNSPRKLQVQVQEALKPVTGQRIARGAVGGSKIQNEAVDTAKIRGHAVTYDCLSLAVQQLFVDVLEANQIFSEVIAADKSVTCSTLVVSGKQFLPGSWSFIDGNGQSRTFYGLKEAGT